MGLKESGLRGSLRNVSVGIDAIPDSAIYQQPWDEGESTTVTDVIGDRNGSLDNPDWVSDAEFEGGWKLNFDNDTVENDPIDNFANRQLLFCITIDSNSTSDQTILNHHDPDEGDVTGFGYAGGGIGTFSDDNAASNRGVSSVALTNRNRIGVWFDNPNNNIRVYINGDRSDDADDVQSSHERDRTMLWGNRPDEGAAVSGDMDNPIVYDTDDPDTDAQTDFDVQNWS